VYAVSLVGAANELYLCMLPWYSGNGAATLLDEFTEVPLTKYGSGGTASSIYLRIFRTSSAAPKIQLAATSTLTTATYTFNFRRIL
jgi:hypothetical protein